MKLKSITELDTNDLLKAIEGNSKKVSNFHYKNDILEFLSIHQISQGEHRILSRLIYETYKRWSRAPLNRRGFSNELVKLFPYIRYGESYVFMLNRDREFFLEKTLKKKCNKTKSKSWFKHFQKFTEKYNLKSGSFYVKDVVLFNLYDKWTYKNHYKRPLGFQQFLKFCRLFFNRPEVKRINNHEWFGVQNNVKEHLTQDLINLMNKNEEKTK